MGTGQKSHIGVRLFFPASTSYVSWAGAFETRMFDCPSVVDSFSAVQPLQRLQEAPLPNPNDDLKSLFENAVAGVMVEGCDDDDLRRRLTALNDQLVQRFSFPWFTSVEVKRKRLAVLEGGFNFDFRRNMMKDARDLGIDLVILDKPDHWLAGPRYAHLRLAFIPLDMTRDNGLPNRIVEAMNDSQLDFDGLTSFSDSYLVPASKAAEMMSLPTPPSKSLARVVDKHVFRSSLEDHQITFCCMDFDDLAHQMRSSKKSIKFPLIAKPVSGGGSQGVVRVNNYDQLEPAIRALVNNFGQRIVVEPYVDGPEFDANFVLLDGRILFCEVSDNLPCAGDSRGAAEHDSFLETGIIFPSALDHEEISLIKRNLYQALVRLGFSTGVFHAEGRIMNSSKHYETGSEGVLDLQPNFATTTKPHVFLLEINARCPGWVALSGTSRCYGISYYVMQLLFAVGETKRAEMLCSPFLDGSQHPCCEAVFLPALTSGILQTEDVVQDFLDRSPDLKSNIIAHHMLIRQGERIPDSSSGRVSWIAACLVATASREKTLRTSAKVRQNVSYSVRGEEDVSKL